ncbi:MAG: adenylate kinase [Gammaproteobacteria bacterium]
MTIRSQSVDALVSAKRILVLGPCGSGKTRLSRELSRILDLPVIHLDANFWRPGWISTPQSEWRDVVSSLIEQESWVMDGTYESTLDLRVPAAEAIIEVNCPRWISLWQVLRRSRYYRNRPRPDAPAGQPIDLAYLRYIWKYPAETSAIVAELIEKHGPDKPVIRLDSRKSMDAFMLALQKR